MCLYVCCRWKRDKFSHAVSEGVVCVCMSIVDGSVTSLAVLSMRVSLCLYVCCRWKRDEFSRAVNEGVVCVCMSVVDGSVTSLAVLSMRASFVSVCLL